MKYFPKIVGDRVYLSPISLDDAERYAAWLNDFSVARFLAVAPEQISLHGERDSLVALSKEHAYAIVEKGKDELLGNCGLFAIESVHRSAEVGIFIGSEEKRGLGFGTEALGLLCDYGFNVLNLRSIHLKTYAFNTRAAACYRKVGFKDSGRLRQAHFYAGEYYDLLFMDLLSEEFGPSKLPPANCS
jgi:RimJ/RimL family protein N-acetyltransferase